MASRSLFAVPLAVFGADLSFASARDAAGIGVVGGRGRDTTGTMKVIWACRHRASKSSMNFPLQWYGSTTK